MDPGERLMIGRYDGSWRTIKGRGLWWVLENG